MKTEQKIGVAIALVPAIGGATGLLLGFFHPATAVAAAVIGIVIGTGVARGFFSHAADVNKN